MPGGPALFRLYDADAGGVKAHGLHTSANRRLAHITGFELRLRRIYRAGGERHSYLSAGCPAAPGFPGATFPLLRASYRFDGGPPLATTLVRTCHVQ